MASHRSRVWHDCCAGNRLDGGCWFALRDAPRRPAHQSAGPGSQSHKLWARNAPYRQREPYSLKLPEADRSDSAKCWKKRRSRPRHLLLLVDQFEEIFRFREKGDMDEAACPRLGYVTAKGSTSVRSHHHAFRFPRGLHAIPGLPEVMQKTKASILRLVSPGSSAVRRLWTFRPRCVAAT